MSASNEILSVEKLTALLQHPEQEVRLYAGFVLGNMGEDASPAIPVLIDMLDSNDLRDRKLAALTLGEIGPAAAEAVPLLLDAANEDNEWLADAAIWALEQIDLADEEPQAEAA